jgi:hypothetical protein
MMWTRSGVRMLENRHTLRIEPRVTLIFIYYVAVRYYNRGLAVCVFFSFPVVGSGQFADQAARRSGIDEMDANCSMCFVDASAMNHGRPDEANCAKYIYILFDTKNWAGSDNDKHAAVSRTTLDGERRKTKRGKAKETERRAVRVPAGGQSCSPPRT